MTTAVDVIIAARDEARLIGACLDALRAQDYDGPVRACVVDNASTDATASIAATRGARVVREAKRGSAAARNAGLRATSEALVAFLDAHVLVAPDWVRRMAEPFDDPQIGGCQSRVDNRSMTPRVQRYLDASQALANDTVLADTVRGERNLYPWVPTAYCMYRRAALDDVGAFDESMVACEDVELAWRVIARGYRLAYVAAAAAIHYELRSWVRFVSKGFAYGRGAAQLQHLYDAHGARTTFSPVSLRQPYEAVLGSLCYRTGFRVQQVRSRVGRAPASEAILPRLADERFRPWFRWTHAVRLRISPSAVYWTDDDRARVIVVRPGRSPHRWVLEATEDFVWRALMRGERREAVADRVVAAYDVALPTAASDLDALIAELLDAGLVEQGREPGGDDE